MINLELKLYMISDLLKTFSGETLNPIKIKPWWDMKNGRVVKGGAQILLAACSPLPPLEH
jgi:hypothetical protein